LETKKEDLIHIVYLRPYKAKSPPPNENDQEDLPSYQRVEMDFEHSFVDPKLSESEPESEDEQIPDLTEITPFGQHTGTDDVLVETEPTDGSHKTEVLPSEDSWLSSPESTKISTPVKEPTNFTDDSIGTSKFGTPGSIATPSPTKTIPTPSTKSPGSRDSKKSTSDSSPDDPRKSDPKPTWHERLTRAKKSFQQLLHRETDEPIQSPERPRTRSQASSASQQHETGARPKRVQFDVKSRTQSDTTTTHVSQRRGGNANEPHTEPEGERPSNLETSEGEGRRQSSRLKAKPQPTYHEPRIETQREIKTRQQKQKGARKNSK
jgi:hypothetical protein